MSMTDAEIKEIVTKRVHAIADDVDWSYLTIPQRQRYYEEWTDAPEIGGLLGQVMEVHNVRVYLKDTVMRAYARGRRPGMEKLLASMSISCGQVTRAYIKPEAVLCDGRDLYTTTVAKEWKGAIMSAFERGCEVRNVRRNVVFMSEHTVGRFVDQAYRDVIGAAAKRLGVEVLWME